MVSWLPDVLQNVSLWGGSGWMLKALHADGVIPFWACFAIINILIRIGLFPLVVYGAKTSARFGKIIPEVQFLLTLFQNDMKKLRQTKAPLSHRVALMRTNMVTLGALYKLHKINPFSVFLSPLLQLPFFWYISVDLRKIVNGLDPALAQQLVDSPVVWIPDLTEPDPWYGLPVLAGVLLYGNVEVAVGKRSLSGPTASKADVALLLKDIFQSFAVFMPCFTSQLPSGVQIYIATSFCFTLVQSAALRTESVRSALGLPSMLKKEAQQAPEAKYAQQFIQLKQLEQQAREERKPGEPIWGKGTVLAHGLEVSFRGSKRKSSIDIKESHPGERKITQDEASTYFTANGGAIHPALVASTVDESPGFFLHGISAPHWQLEEQRLEQLRLLQQHQLKEAAAKAAQDSNREYMPQFSDEVMEKANRGEYPMEIQFAEKTPSNPKPSKVSVKRLERTRAGSKRTHRSKK